MNETRLLYLHDSYLRDFNATVVDVTDRNVVFDQTLFFPRGGGQQADRGVVRAGHRRFRILAVEKRGAYVYHTLDAGPPEAGERVSGHVDWDYRYKMMRTHTALHVLSAVIYREYQAQVTGCQMHEDRARMDFTMEQLTPERVERVEKLSNEAIKAGHPVRARFIPRAVADEMPELIRTKINLIPVNIDPVRIVEIVGLDTQADGGTHVANTMEVVGLRVIKTENKGKQNRRLEIELDSLPTEQGASGVRTS